MLKSVLYVGVGSFIGVTENYTACIGNLIIEKFTEIFHIHFAFIYVYHDSSTIQNSIVKI